MPKGFSFVNFLRKSPDFLLFLLKSQGIAVHAVALAGGLGAVVEDVAEVAATFGAHNLVAAHAKAIIRSHLNTGGSGRGEEAGPAGARLKLGIGGEEQVVVGGAIVGTDGVVIVVFAGEGALGTLLAQDVVLVGREEFFPLGIGVAHRKFVGLAGERLRLEVRIATHGTGRRGCIGGYVAFLRAGRIKREYRNNYY